MGTVKLSKGQNTGLNASGLGFRLITSPPGGVDTSALVLDESGKVGVDEDFVFYNQPKHPSGAVRHISGNGTGGDSIEVTLAELDAGVDRVLITASVDAGSIGRYSQVRLLVSDLATGVDELEIDVVSEGSESALMLAEIYRRNGAWKLRAVSQGYSSGLAGLATDFGIDIDKPAVSPIPTPSPTLPETPEITLTPAPAAAPLAAPSGVSYSRPPKPAAAESQHATASAAMPRSATRPPAAAARRKGSADAELLPALTAASSTWHEIQDRSASNVALLGEMISSAVGAFETSRPSVLEDVKELDRCYQVLLTAWRKRFSKFQPPASPRDEPFSLNTGVMRKREWIVRVEDLVRELDSGTVKLTSEGRRNYRNGLAGQYTELVKVLPSVKTGLRQAAWDTMNAHGPNFGATAANQAAQQWLDIPTPPAPIGPFTQPLADRAPFMRGLGPTNVLVGYARPESITFSTERPATSSGRRNHVIALPGTTRVPIVLNLDVVGGYVTSTPQIIETTALSLLSALPPGQVKLDVFDPNRLGESANFLYGLGDVAEKVIGQKVRTTERELADLLVEVEEHITFVTQKYLQGSFDSLTAYNQASGDVSEPYRLLVIYDYPSGFSRDHQYDKEQLDRFQKILAAGRRCGVFTLIAHSGSASEHANRIAQEIPWLNRSHFNPGLVVHSLGSDSRSGQLLRGDFSGISGSQVHWAFEAVDVPSPDIATSLIAHIERGLRTASDIRVDPDRVSELARLTMERDVSRGTRGHEAMAAAYEPSTWWQGSSLDDVTAIVGRLGASDTARLRLDSQTASSVLIGGRPGSGKSVLLHALIMNLTQQYGPDELSLYLVDFKEGVEFKQYATYRLPQAKVVAIESEREFGVSVLESLADEIVRRGQLFRHAGSGEETNLGRYRLGTGNPLPRVVLIIDEFQVMFDRDDKVGSRAAELLERVLRTGRAFGVHIILASQTIAGMPALGRHLPNLIPTRVVLQSADADSRLLLSDDNADAKLLSRPGEAILNTKGGLKDANQRFQSTYWEPEDRAWVLERLQALAAQAGHRTIPVVFEGQRGAAVEDVELKTFTTPFGKNISLPLGTPMTLAGPVRAELRREPGGNLLIVTDEPGALLVGLGVLGQAGVSVELLDFGGADEEGEARLRAVAQASTTTTSRRREAKARLSAVAAIVGERLQLHDYTATPIVVAIHGMHRAREFDSITEYDEQSESGLLKKIVRDGPEVGVHVVAWIDRKSSVDRRMSYEVLREFALRLCGPTGREDSLALIDSDEAATLHPGQAVFDDHDQGKRYRMRVFSSPASEWAADLLGQAR